MYQAGIYCRISIEEKERESEYSSSIHSQIQMAREYLSRQADIMEVDVYADDGASGSHYERSEFQRMLADMELGRINMVILKDISRLGREQVATNYYLNNYFPQKQVRLLSLLDHYDSAVTADDELLEMKTLLHDRYLRDTSQKIKASIQLKRSRGEYTAREAPFGYFKNQAQHLQVDPYAAQIVKKMYRLYLHGFGYAAICRILNEEHLPSPTVYKKEILKDSYPGKVGKGLWTMSSVRSILKNPLYTGSMVIRKYDKPSYKLPNRQTIPLEQQELVPHAHEAIISPETFAQVQQMSEKRRVPYFKNNKEVHKYAGLLFCGHCQTAMRKCYLASRHGYDGYQCGFHQRMGKNYCQRNHITLETLDQLVLFALNQQLRQRNTDDGSAASSQRREESKKQHQLAQLEAKMERSIACRQRAYEQFMDAILSKEEYQKQKQHYEQQREQYQNQWQKLQEQNNADTNVWRELFRLGHLSEKQLTREVLLELIETIEVSANQNIEISFRFAAEQENAKIESKMR